jgi:hypothetical protein
MNQGGPKGILATTQARRDAASRKWAGQSRNAGIRQRLSAATIIRTHTTGPPYYIGM